MVPGPVFDFELLTTARRGRFYALRAAYAAALLMIFWAIHSDWSTRSITELTINQMVWFAVACFCSIAVAQIIVVLILTPALVAGVIADEKQRKTLHYLLASRLTGPEIVVGKLLARMLHVAVLLGVGFPVLSLLVLLGGIDPFLIVLACGAAASTAWFLSALSIWVSTIARKARDALFITYGLEFLWLFLPLLMIGAPTTGWSAIDQVIDLLIGGLSKSTPVEPGRQFLYAVQSGAGTPLPSLIEMIQCQLGAGILLAILAAFQVRPVFRAQQGGGGKRRLLAALFSPRRPSRLWSRPTLGDQPMLWKELFTSRARGFTRFVALLVTLIAGGFLLYYTLWFGILAFLEMRDQGDSIQSGFWYPAIHHWQFYWFLRTAVPVVYVAGILSVAGAAAASITSEHEEDTWTSLTSTDLSGREIILAKLVGALWRPRGIVLVILFMATAGAISHAIQPWSLLPLCLALAIYGWFAAALGVCISLQLRSTWRAQFLTTASLLLINLVGQAILSNVRRWAPQLWPGFTPYEISKLLVSPTIALEWANEMKSWSLGWPALDDGPFWRLVFGIVSLACYFAGAIALTLLSVMRFEAAAGRARRNHFAGLIPEAGRGS
jgi:ABC-type transport system involved in multi-copper enzyme maturation permease subunit